MLDLTDRNRTFIIHSGAVMLALMVADPSGDVHKRILLEDNCKCFGIATFSHEIDILWDILMNRAGSDTRCHIAVRERKSLSYLHTVFPSSVLMESRCGRHSLVIKGLKLFHIYAVH